MAELINGIILSSGTVVNIPIFPTPEAKTLPAACSIYTRHGGVLCEQHSTGSLPDYMAVTQDDMLELARIFYDYEATSVSYTVATVGAHNVQMVLWGTNANGEYYMINPFKRTGTAHVVAINYRIFPYTNVNFWNGTDAEDHDFYTVAGQVSSYVAIPYCNVRENNWSITIASRSKYTVPYGGGDHVTLNSLLNRIATYQELYPNSNIAISVFDPESNTDPYIIDDPSQFGGGTGAHEDPDEIEKATIPPLPSLSAVNTGLVTMYGATNAQLGALGAYLWSNLWDIDTNFKKLFADPMNCLIGLSIVPVIPSMGGAQNVRFGNIDTPIALNVLTSQYVELDCGTLSIKEYIGSFLDYSPYVNISIYLPYIGYRELSPDDVMNDTIHVVYHIDVLTGGCCAMIETGKKGLLYSFNGSCIANVPITAINYSGAIQNAVSAVGAGLTTVAGIATGAAPVAAVGAASMLSNAANTAMNSKPTIQRSGSMGGSAGIMSYQKPLLVVTRPRMSVPDKLNKFAGLTTNVTMNLSQCTGFTQVELIHLDNVPCTQAEREELLSLLKTGVIF